MSRGWIGVVPGFLAWYLVMYDCMPGRCVFADVIETLLKQPIAHGLQYLDAMHQLFSFGFIRLRSNVKRYGEGLAELPIREARRVKHLYELETRVHRLIAPALMVGSTTVGITLGCIILWIRFTVN